MYRNYKVFKWVSKVVISIFLFNTSFLGNYAACAYSSTSSLYPPLIKQNKKHYSLFATGITFYNSLHVLLPERNPTISYNDLEVKGVGFNLSVKRIYTGGNISQGIFGKGWGLANYEKLKVISKKRILIIEASGDKEYRLTDSGIYICADGSEVEQIDDGTFQKKSTSGVTTTFLADGKLENKKDQNGNLLNYLYRNNLLSEIVNDSSGRSLRFFYSSDGLVKQVSDDIGRTVFFRYDKKRCLEHVDRFNMQTLAYAYDLQSRLVEINDYDGVVTRIEYTNGKDLTVKKVETNGKQWVSFDSHSAQGPFILNDHLGNRFTYDYKYNNNVLTLNITSNFGWRTTYEFARDGKLLAWNSPTGYQILLKYDSLGRIIGTADTNSLVMSYRYKGKNHLPVEIRDSRGPRQSFNYDIKNNLVQAHHSGHEPIFYARHSNGFINQVKLGDYVIKSSEIDKNGNFISESFGSDTADKYFYDKVGRIIKKEARDGSIFEYTYNDLNKITSIQRGSRKFLDLVYDTSGHLVKLKDGDGREIRYELNETEGTSKAVLPDGTQYSFRQVENENSIVDTYTYPNKATRLIRSNLSNQLIEKTDSFGNKTRFDYSPKGLLKKKTNPDGNSIEFFYDGSGRLIEKKYSDGTYVLFRYRNGRLVSIKTPDFHQEYSYNEEINAFEVITDRESGLSVKYAHNRKGKLSSIDISGVGKIKYTYDKNNRLNQISDPDSNITQFFYNKAGRVTEKKYPNGIMQTITYNEENVPVSVVVGSHDTELLNEKYIYGDDGFVREIHDNITNTIKKYSYNDNEALESFERESGGINQKISYFYDQNNNLKQEINGNEKKSYLYDGIGRLIKSDKRQFKYDQRGNRSFSTSEMGQVRYEYDIDNRLKRVHFPDGSIKNFRYDHRGRIVFIKYGKNERHIFWNDNHRLFEVDKHGKLIKLYIYSERLDEIISVKMGETYYLHQDQIGSVRLVTDSSGRAVTNYEYLPFGKPLSINQERKHTTDYMFYAGRPYDPDLDFYYLRARFYDPESKQFVTRDPVGGTIAVPNTTHPYLYALNNPLNIKDPGGEIILSLLGVAAVTMVVAVAAVVGVAKTMPSSGFSSYRQNEEYSSDPGRTYRNKPQEMKDFGDGVEKYIKPLTELGGKGMKPIPFDVRDLTDPDEKKAELARKKALTEVLRPDKVASDLVQIGINEKIKEVSPTINGNPILEKITGEVVKKVVEDTRKKIPGTTIPKKPKPPQPPPVVPPEDPPKPPVVPPEDPPKPPVVPPEDPPKPPVVPPEDPPKPPVVPPEDPPKPPVVPPEDPPKPPVVPPEDPPKPPVVPPEDPPEDPPEEPQPPRDENSSRPGRGEEGDSVTTGDGRTFVLNNGEWVEVNDNPFDDNYMSRDQLMASNNQDRERENAGQFFTDTNLDPNEGKYTSDDLDKNIDDTQKFVATECNDRKPCPAGQTCEDGKCVDKHTDCSKDEDCPKDHECKDGKCVKKSGTKPKSLAISPANKAVKINEPVSLKAILKDEDGATKDVTQEATWTPGNPFSKGEIGQYTVKATYENLSGSAMITVVKEKGMDDISVNSKTITVTFFDHGKEDGDMIDILINGKAVFSGIRLTKAPQSRTITMNADIVVFGFRALNVGKIPPNTATVTFSSVVKGKSRQQYQLSKNQKTNMNITYAPK